MKYWLFKSEPFKWSWDQQKAKGDAGEEWDGIRNYQARNNMREMKIGDRGFFYHSQSEKAVVGIVEVIAESHPDSTTDDDRWDCVDIKAVAPMPKPVTLAMCKDEPRLAEAETLPEAEEGLRAIFLAAQGDANAYAAERLQEVFRVAGRALALSEAFPVEGSVSSRAGPHEGPWYRRLQRAVASREDPDVGSACQFADLQRILSRQVERDIPSDSRDAEHVEFWRGQRQQDRHGVVLARVSVDDDGACHQPTLSSWRGNVKRPAPAKTRFRRSQNAHKT